MYVNHSLTKDVPRSRIRPLGCRKTCGHACHSVVEWRRLGPLQVAVVQLHRLGAALHLQSGKTSKIKFFV